MKSNYSDTFIKGTSCSTVPIFYWYLLSIKPLFIGHPLSSEHQAKSRRWPLNRGATVVQSDVMFKTSKHLVRILTPFLAAKSAAPWTFFFHSGKLLKTLTIISQVPTLFRIEVVTIFRCNTHWNKKKEATSSHLNDIFQFSFPDPSQLVWECGIFMLWYSLFVSLICDCLLTSNVGYVYHSGSTCTDTGATIIPLLWFTMHGCIWSSPENNFRHYVV